MNAHLEAANLARSGPRAALKAGMAEARAHLLFIWQAYAQALRQRQFRVPYHADLNLPLWELGHIGWFEEWWLARNPLRLQGASAPDAPRAASVLARSDALFNSSTVPHATRWQLSLPTEAQTFEFLARVRERSLRLLEAAPEDDDALYAIRLVLLHEEMHAEAWIYMAQALGMALPGFAPAPAASLPSTPWHCNGGRFNLGCATGGFAFDNELSAHEVEVAPFTIDRQAITWAQYLPFVEAQGYLDERLWTPEGWRWRQAQPSAQPRYLHCLDGAWEVERFGQWHELNLQDPAVHLSHFEAQAWCRFANRRLPTEAEWECAAVSAAAQGEPFLWGQVWEWTSSAFSPYPGFVPHPYRDYSAPWFDGRPVLRGASFATRPSMHHPKYRNFYPARRNDIFSGLRTCAI
jgi:gamma-glutamyl hercynylcysteine S-oxide synthase